MFFYPKLSEIVLLETCPVFSLLHLAQHGTAVIESNSLINTPQHTN